MGCSNSGAEEYRDNEGMGATADLSGARDLLGAHLHHIDIAQRHGRAEARARVFKHRIPFRVDLQLTVLKRGGGTATVGRIKRAVFGQCSKAVRFAPVPAQELFWQWRSLHRRLRAAWRSKTCGRLPRSPRPEFCTDLAPGLLSLCPCALQRPISDSSG